MDLYRQALGIFDKCQNHLMQAQVHFSLNQMYLDMEEPGPAKEELLSSYKERLRLHDYRDQVNCLLLLCYLATNEKDFIQASAWLAEADDIIARCDIRDPQVLGLREGIAGTMFFEQRQHPSAKQCFRRLIEITGKAGLYYFLTNAYI